MRAVAGLVDDPAAGASQAEGPPDKGPPEAPVAGSVRISVSDSGPGLPLDEQPHVWDSFFRGAHVAGLNVAPGSGIGLAVVKALVEAHGGQVGLDSTPGEGATFWFDLPPAPGPAPAAGPGGQAAQETPASTPEPAASLS